MAIFGCVRTPFSQPYIRDMLRLPAVNEND